MDKKLALENVGFVYSNGKYKIELCTSENGTKYVLTCDLGKAGFIVETTHPDGREDSNGAGKYKGTPIWDKINEILTQLNEEMSKEIEIVQANGNIQNGKYEEVRVTKQITKTKQSAPITMQDKQVSDLTLDDIKSYICSTATDQEAYMFLKLCQARGLNPFTKEAYLVKYGSNATIIVGKDAFTRRAELNINFDGFRAGIIVIDDGKECYNEGTYAKEGQTIVGGWAEVFRKDKQCPYKMTVSLSEYNTGQSLWKKLPGTMIRKVALVQALREAFPSEFAGMYDSSETGEETPY
jgi:phage recombination protein Bet